MTIGQWGFTNPAALWLALLALPIIAFHILKPRRVRQQVSAVLLWSKVERPVTAAQPWQRLIPSWLLAAQVLAALLLAVALAGPVRLTPQELGEHTIFVIDASSSMQATDGSPSRLDDAKDRAVALRDEIPGAGEASLIEAGAGARALLTHSVDADEFAQALDGIKAYDGEADFVDAFALAASLNVGDRPTRVVLISDGGVSADNLRLIPENTRYERIGSSSTNRGISQIAVEPTADGLVVRLAVHNYGGPAATMGVRVDVDGVTAARTEATVDTNETENLAVPIPPGEKIEAFLDSDDAYDLDDRVVATVSQRADIDVALLGPENPFLDTALAVLPGVTVSRLEADETVDYSRFDAVIVDRVAPPENVNAPMWLIAPPGGAAGVTSAGEVERPVLTLIDSSSGLVSGLDLSEVLVARSQQVTLPGDARVVLGAENAPLLARIRPGPTTDGVDAVYQSFALAESNLPLQSAFPILVDRVLTELASASVPPARLQVGANLPVDPRLEALVTDPDGTTTAIAPGNARVVANQKGFWQIDQDDKSTVVAVNPLPGESQILPAADLPIAEAFEASTGKGTQAEIPLRRWVILALLAVVAAEWLLARRRIGVNPSQWRLATGLRVVVALALIGTFFNIGFDRPVDDLATVFVLDASESVSAKRSEADGFITSALADMPDDSKAGIVVFGGNARLENLVSENPLFSGMTVQIDREATDLASALRLGAAVLPRDARGRLVLITDGRSTTGDLAGEIRRLAEDGVPVDIVTLDGTESVDVAISSVSVPSSAQVGERVSVNAKIYSSVTTTADVVLLQDGQEIDRQTAELVPGDNTVAFTQVVDEDTASVARYQVEVEAAVDPVNQNNRAYAAVPIVGAEKVLVVNGSTAAVDNAAPIELALDAVGLDYDTVPSTELPPLDELISYSSIVMVNVDSFDLSEASVADLTTAVRGLGRGMVVIGGTKSFALGGYLNSKFEELLPVVSEVTDPLRRQTVAEVFAIDTSGSMGACHCDESGENGMGGTDFIDGGVEKTAIARNATAKAIAALSPTDEVGILTMDNSDSWALDLKASPTQDEIDAGLSQLTPDGPTYLDTGLRTAADQLLASQASLKHIILFSDGFTEPNHLAALESQAAELYNTEGITVSVVATGEGAAKDLEPIALAGGGRFYPGQNLEQIPDLLVQEAVVASRSFITEGEFSPVISSNAKTVASLSEAPIIEGYLATTAKPLARVDLRIGPDNDPLLSSWQTGSGRVTAWTSDSGTRWNKNWAAWDRYPDFWANVIKETFPSGDDGGGVSATITGDSMTLTLEGVDGWADNARAVAQVTGPEGESEAVTLERVDGETFSATVPVDEAGVYAVGASVFDGDESVWSGVGLSTRSYPAEFLPTNVVDASYSRVPEATGGRAEITADQAFSDLGTQEGSRPVDLARWLLWLAVLAWPVAVGISRLAWRRGVLATVENRAASTIGELQRRLPRIDRPYHRPQSTVGDDIPRPGANQPASGPTPSAPPSGPSSPIGTPGTPSTPTVPTRPTVPTGPAYIAPGVAGADPSGNGPKPAERRSAPVGVADSGRGSDGQAGGSTLDQLLKKKRQN